MGIDSGEVNRPRIVTAGLALYPPSGVPFYVRQAVPPPSTLSSGCPAFVLFHPE